MKKIISFAMLLFLGVICSACVNSFAVQQLNEKAAQYLSDGDINAAISRLESSVDLDPQNYESRYNLAVAYIRINKCEEALKQIDVAKTIIKDEASAYYTAASAEVCLAEKLIKQKDESGNIQYIKYTLDEMQKVAKNYVDYLESANKDFTEYVRILPNADDSKGVLQAIEQNKINIDDMKKRYYID